MFTSKTIYTATTVRRDFAEIVRKMKQKPEPILISQKGGNFLVLVDAEHFEDLVEFRLAAEQCGFRQSSGWSEKNDDFNAPE